MREALRPILSCALVVAVSAAVHGQLVGTKFEKYTRFLTALILLSLLITPMLNLFRAGGELITQESTVLQQTGQPGQPQQPEQTEDPIPQMTYTDALIFVLQRKVEDDARSLLKTQYGILSNSILQVRAAMDGSDPEAIRVASVFVRIRGEADSGEIEKTLKERYGCENVSVIVDA